MQFFTDCMMCLIDHQADVIKEDTDEKRKKSYMHEIFNLIGESGPEMTAPVMAMHIRNVRRRYYPGEKSMTAVKSRFNRFVMKMEDELRSKINASEEPLREALRLARIGNYIDFSSIGDVDTDEFLKLFEKEEDIIDPVEYGRLLADLDNARELVYLLDNCGELVIDKLVMERLKTDYPNLTVRAVVRGGEALNDATVEDAAECGLTQVAEVLSGGAPVQGYDMTNLPKETKDAFDNADLMISKGQGNFESLYGSGYPIYYLFLCKCHLFQKMFKAEPLEGRFLYEKRLKLDEGFLF